MTVPNGIDGRNIFLRCNGVAVASLRYVDEISVNPAKMADSLASDPIAVNTAGRAEIGDIKVTCRYVPAEFASFSAKAISGVKDAWNITWSNGATLNFDGQILKVGIPKSEAGTIVDYEMTLLYGGNWAFAATGGTTT